MMSMTYNYFVRCKTVYSNKEVIKCLIIIKKSNNQRSIDKAKIKLLDQLHQIITKNIDNFFNMIKNIDKEPIHTKDDMVGESYIVLQNCIGLFQIKKGKYFFWYYNKALTRAFIRVMEKNYQKHRLLDSVDEEYEDLVFSIMANQEQDLMEYYIDSYGLDKLEKRVAMALLNGDKIRDFLKVNKDISWNKYYVILSSIKKKFEPLREELKTYTDVKINKP